MQKICIFHNLPTWAESYIHQGLIRAISVCPNLTKGKLKTFAFKVKMLRIVGTI